MTIKNPRKPKILENRVYSISDTLDLILYWTFSCPSHEITEYVGRLSGTRSEIKLLDEGSRSGSKYDLDFSWTRDTPGFK